MTETPTLFDATDGFRAEPWQLARSQDPETSHKAARALGGRAGTMRRALLEVFRLATLTAEEAAAEAGYGPADGAWKRVSDLTNLGLLEWTGLTRVGSRGREQRVLRITTAGRNALVVIW